MGHVPRLPEMFPDLADDIGVARTLGIDDDEILTRITALGAKEPGKFDLPAAPRPGTAARVGQAAKESATLNFMRRPEDFPEAETAPEAIEETFGELLGFAPWLLGGELAAIPLLTRVLGGGVRRAAAAKGAAKLAQMSPVAQGAARGTTVGGLLKVPAAVSTVKAGGDFQDVMDVLTDPRDIAIFGGLGGLTKLSRMPILGDPKFRAFYKEARLLKNVNEKALIEEAQGQMFRRPGEARFRNPEVQEVFERHFGPEPAAGAAKADTEPDIPSEFDLEPTRGPEGKGAGVEGLPGDLRLGPEAVIEDPLLREIFRFTEVEPFLGAPERGPFGAGPTPARESPLGRPLATERALPTFTKGSAEVLERLETFRRQARQAAKPTEIAPSLPARTASLRGPRPSPELAQALEEVGGAVGPSGVEKQAPTERVVRGAGEREIPSFEGVTPSLEPQGEGRVPGGQRGQAAAPRVFELAETVEGVAAEQLGLPGVPEGGFAGIRKGTEIAGGIDLPRKLTPRMVAGLGNLGAGWFARLGRGAGGKVWSRIKAAVKNPEDLAPHQREIMGRARATADRLEAAEVARLPEVNRLMETARAGEFSKDWYDPTVLRQEFGQNSEIMADFLAATSPMASVESNLTLALRAFRQWQAGEPFDGFVQVVKANLTRAVRREPLSGNKVSAFSQALKGDQNAVVVDRWMMRLFNQPGIKEPNATQYALIESLVRDMARELGVTPAQAQAMMWSGFKVESQGLTTAMRGARPIGELLQRRLRQLDLFGKSRKALPESTAVAPRELDYVGFISAERHGMAPEQARNLMEALRRDLSAAGMEAKDASGRFEGVDEMSFMVPLQNMAQEGALRDLGVKYGQQAIIVGRGSAAEMRFLSGPDAGQSVRSTTLRPLGLEAADGFREISTSQGPYKFSYNFDFNKKTPYKEVVRLEHYAPKALSVISPEKAGTGPFKDAEQRRPGLAKAFWYRSGTAIEPRFKGMVEHYAEAPLALYDVKADPLGFVKGKQTGLQFEQTLKAKGYDGYTDGNTVATWETIRPWAFGFDKFMSPAEEAAFAQSVKLEINKRLNILVDEGVFPGQPQQPELPLRGEVLGPAARGQDVIRSLVERYGIAEPGQGFDAQVSGLARSVDGDVSVGGTAMRVNKNVLYLEPDPAPPIHLNPDPVSLSLLPELQEAATRRGLRAEIAMQGERYAGVRVVGEVEGQAINALFSGPDGALRFLGETKPFDPAPAALKFAPEETMKQVLQQRMAERMKSPTLPGTKGKLCLSPCVNVNLVSDAERATVMEALKETPAEAEAARLVTGRLPFFKSIASQFKNVPTFGKLLSPSFYLEKFPAGVNIMRGIDEGYRKMGQWLVKHNESLDKTPFGSLREGSPEALAVGLSLDQPQFRGKFVPKIHQMANTLKAKFEEHFREIGELAPGEKVGRVKDYFTRIFDREELELALKQDIEALRTSDSPTAAARLAQMSETLRKTQAGEQIIYEALPESLRMRFFESRTGRAGYSFDAVKAYRTYQAALGRKLILGPIAKDLVPTIPDLPLAYRGLAKTYLRDAFGYSERLLDPMDRVSRIVKEVQFFRTIGFNPATAVKNLFQQLVTGAEIGPKHLARGWQSYLTEAGKRVFDDSGHALDVPNIFLHERSTFTPLWKQAIHYSGWMFNKVETTNRGTAYLGALSRWFERNGAKAKLTFEEALEKRVIPKEARVFADDIVRKTQFRYGKVDLPLALREPVVGALFQFASFPIKIGELIWKWSVREGAAGRMKLMAFIAASSGVAALGDMMGAPTLADDTGAPLDLTEMTRAMGAMTEGDWAKARSHLGRGVKPPFLGMRLGPTGSIISDATEVGKRWVEGERVSKLVETFGRRNLSMVPVNRLLAATEQFEAGGSARDFVQQVMGFPTHDGIVRAKYLQLVEQGKMEMARELLAEYRKARGGNLPLNYAKVQAIRREQQREYKQQQREQRGETRSQRITRKFKGDVERALF